MRRPSFVAPSKNVTAFESDYLASQFSEDDAAERRARLEHFMRRLVRKGRDPKRVHSALARGINERYIHDFHQYAKRVNAKTKRQIARARKDVERALASLRALVTTRWLLDDDDLFRMRDVLLRDVPDVPSDPRGRPWTWKQAAEAGLKEAGLTVAERRELLEILGFIGPE